MPRLTPLAESLPQAVPFVGPEAQERARGAVVPRADRRQRERLRPLAAGGGGDGRGGGESPGATATRRRTTCARRSRRIMGWTRANVMIGEGIDALLGNLVRLLVAPGRRW